jgi:phosphoserine phosphatase
VEVDLAGSFAYADSISDLPLLELVGNPTAVYPDEQLATVAREQHWAMLYDASIVKRD